MPILKYTLANKEDEVDLSVGIKILYNPRKGYEFKDCLVTYPTIDPEKVWFVWEKKL